jgi:hypothetical protein
MFRVSTDARTVGGPQRDLPDVFFLPATLGVALEGSGLEEILLLRDELANVAWAVEERVESPTGQPLDRAEAFHRADPATPPPPASAAAYSYRLATSPPEYWLPLLPTRPAPTLPPIRLLRAGTPSGRMLAPERQPNGPNPLLLFGEEVPREGARLRRAFQYARWIDGRTFLWSGRQKRVGRGEGSSGLRFDVLETTPPPGSG